MRLISFTHTHCLKSKEGYGHQYAIVFDANEEITEADIINILRDGLISAHNSKNTTVATDNSCPDQIIDQVIDSRIFTIAPFSRTDAEIEKSRQLNPDKPWRWAKEFKDRTSGPALAYNKLIEAGIRTNADLLNVDPSKLKQFGENCITYTCGYMLGMGLVKTANEAVSKFIPPKGAFSSICVSAAEIAERIKAYIQRKL